MNIWTNYIIFLITFYLKFFFRLTFFSSFVAVLSASIFISYHMRTRWSSSSSHNENRHRNFIIMTVMVVLYKPLICPSDGMALIWRLTAVCVYKFWRKYINHLLSLLTLKYTLSYLIKTTGWRLWHGYKRLKYKYKNMLHSLKRYIFNSRVVFRSKCTKIVVRI